MLVIFCTAWLCSVKAGYTMYSLAVLFKGCLIFSVERADWCIGLPAKDKFQKERGKINFIM